VLLSCADNQTAYVEALFYLVSAELTANLDPPQGVFRRLHELRLRDTKIGPVGGRIEDIDRFLYYTHISASCSALRGRCDVKTSTLHST